jgi:hypothetical protein
MIPGYSLNQDSPLFQRELLHLLSIINGGQPRSHLETTCFLVGQTALLQVSTAIISTDRQTPDLEEMTNVPQEGIIILKLICQAFTEHIL